MTKATPIPTTPDDFCAASLRSQPKPAWFKALLEGMVALGQALDRGSRERIELQDRVTLLETRVAELESVGPLLAAMRSIEKAAAANGRSPTSGG